MLCMLRSEIIIGDHRRVFREVLLLRLAIIVAGERRNEMIMTGVLVVAGAIMVQERCRRGREGHEQGVQDLRARVAVGMRRVALRCRRVVVSRRPGWALIPSRQVGRTVHRAGYAGILVVA